MKKKNLFMSILAATFGAAVTVGGTYAIFTSEAKTNISVTSGKVSLEAAVSNLKTSSGEWDEVEGKYVIAETTTQGTFTNGGTAVLDADGALTLDKMSPMDKVEFDITVKNLSNIAIKARTVAKITTDNGLFAGLKIKIDNQELVDIATYSMWEDLAVGSADKVVHVSVELPETAGNEYQDKACKLQFVAEAVQGNAHVVNEEYHKVDVSDPTKVTSNIADMINEAKQAKSENEENEQIVYIPATEEPIKLPSNISGDIVIQGAGAGETVVNAAGSGSIAQASNTTIKDLTLTLGNSAYHGFQHSDNLTFDGVTFEGLMFTYGNQDFVNCTFIQTAAEYNMWAYGNDCSWTNCYFKSNGKFINVYNEGNDHICETVFEGCTFENTGAANKSAVNVKATCGSKKLKYNVVINNCTTVGDFPTTKRLGKEIVMIDDGDSEFVTITLDGETIYSYTAA